MQNTREINNNIESLIPNTTYNNTSTSELLFDMKRENFKNLDTNTFELCKNLMCSWFEQYKESEVEFLQVVYENPTSEQIETIKEIKQEMGVSNVLSFRKSLKQTWLDEEISFGQGSHKKRICDVLRDVFSSLDYCSYYIKKIDSLFNCKLVLDSESGETFCSFTRAIRSSRTRIHDNLEILAIKAFNSGQISLIQQTEDFLFKVKEFSVFKQENMNKMCNFLQYEILNLKRKRVL